MGLTVSFPSALRISSVPARGCSEPGPRVRCRMEAHPHWANTRSLGHYHRLLLQSGGGSCHSSPELLGQMQHCRACTPTHVLSPCVHTIFTAILTWGNFTEMSLLLCTEAAWSCIKWGRNYPGQELAHLGSDASLQL